MAELFKKPNLSKAGQTISASSNGKVSDDKVPVAKGPLAPKTGDAASAKGPPSKPSSDSAVMASTTARSSASSAPPKKPPPQFPPKSRSSSLSLKAAYSSRTGASAATASASATQSTAAPASASASTAAPAATSKSGTKSLDEQGQAMLSKQQTAPKTQDPGMSYTWMVLEAARQSVSDPAGTEGADPEASKKKQWSANVAKISVEISRKPLSTVALPTPLMGKMLNPQELEAGMGRGSLPSEKESRSYDHQPTPGSGRSISLVAVGRD